MKRSKQPRQKPRPDTKTTQQAANRLILPAVAYIFTRSHFSRRSQRERKPATNNSNPTLEKVSTKAAWIEVKAATMYEAVKQADAAAHTPRRMEGAR